MYNSSAENHKTVTRLTSRLILLKMEFSTFTWLIRKSIILFALLILIATPALSQDTLKSIIVPGKILDGDTIAFIDLSTSVIFPKIDFSNTKELLRYDRLVYNVRIVYPYAKMAAAKLKEYRHKLDSLPTAKARRIFLRNAQKELEAKFGDKIRAMTFTQGKILIKLIYRETGNSTLDVVKELRGSFNAFIWQTMAKIFGYDLQTPYDPKGDDQAIERIIQMIDSGLI